MRIASEDGSIHSNAVYVNVVVDAPYWQRWWFNALIAVAALVVAFLLFWIRSRWIRKREMRALEKERLMHAIRVSRLTAIQSQMNPHFLFNALNSIQSFIYQNDKQSAATYLGKFSDLVRAVLSYSDKPTVPLAAELDIIRWYVALEGLQLDAPVEPEIHVDPAVDADFVEIPPLLLQPYAENSMKHGLRHKRGPKKLVIRIEPISRGIRVIMEDNGVGRKASAAINQSAPKTHASFATSANSERLSLLNREDGEKVSVQIEDLYDADSQPAGTRVTLNLLIAAE
jgi:LytS/YehU family sensor histidine kinase